MDDLDSGTSTLPGEEDAMIEHDEVIQVQIDSKELSLGQRDRDLSEVDGVYLTWVLCKDSRIGRSNFLYLCETKYCVLILYTGCQTISKLFWTYSAKKYVK